MVFWGLISRFSAVYNLGFTKSAVLKCLVLQQFANHGILELLITDEDQSDFQSTQLKALCAKFIIQTRISEPYCQNQNHVEKFVQTTTTAVSQI